MDAAIKFPDLQSSIRGTNAPLVIDVRRTPAFKASTEMIAGALRRDPDEVASWARELPRAAKAVVYCVHGHEVSQGVAKALHRQGFATEIARRMLELGFGPMRLHRIRAEATVDHAASIRVLERIGMAREGVCRDCIFARGRWWTEARYD